MARRHHGSTPAVVAAAQARDDHAISTIFDSVYPRLRRFIAFTLDDDEKAEAIVGEIFPAVLASIPHYSEAAPSVEAHCFFVAWGILRGSHKEALPSTAFELPDSYLDEDQSQAVGTHLASDEVVAAFRQLPPLWQELLGLRIVAALTIDDAAYVLRRQVDPLRSLQTRSLGALGEWMDQFASDGSEA